MNLDQLKTLIKVADKLDYVGEKKEATALDSVIKKISEDIFGESETSPEDIFGESDSYYEDPEYGQDFEEPQHPSDLAEFPEFNMTLGEAYRKYNGLRPSSYFHPDNMFDRQNPMSEFDSSDTLVNQWDALKAASGTNRAVEIFLKNLHDAWFDLKYGEPESPESPESPGVARLETDVSVPVGDPNIRKIQGILGISETGKWDPETASAIRTFLDRNQSLLFHGDYPTEDYARSIMMYGPRGFQVRNSDQPEITGNRYSDWAKLIQALDESDKSRASMLEELGSRASMNDLSSDFSLYKGLVRR